MTFEEQINQLLDYVVKNDKVGVEKMLNEGADLDYTTKEVYSPLMAAVVEGNPQMVTFLLEKGADVNLVGPRYETALDMANNLYEAMRRNGSTADMVTYRDIRNILKGKDAKTALEVGVAFKDSEKIVQKGEEAFLKALCTVARTGKKSRLVDFIDNQMNSTVDSVAASWLKEEALAGDIPSIAEALAARYENLDEADDLGNTFLHNAVIQGKEKVAAALLKVGADASVENGDGDTPLDIAIKTNNMPLVNVFLKKGDISKPMVNQIVEEAINQGHTDLLDGVIKARKKDVDLKKAFLYVLKDKADLKYRGDWLDTDPSYQNQVPMAEVILKHGMNAKGLETKEGEPILLACIKNPQWRMLVPSLIQNGAAVSSLKDKNGNTPLILAVSNKLEGLAQDLIKQGHDVNETNKMGATPLMAAAETGASLKLIQALVDNGADVMQELPSNHKNAMTIAAEAGHFNVVQNLKPFYPALKEDGINGLMHLERSLFTHSLLDQQAVRGFVDSIRKENLDAQKEALKAQKRKRIEKRKEGVKKTWALLRDVFFKTQRQ